MEGGGAYNDGACTSLVGEPGSGDAPCAGWDTAGVGVEVGVGVGPALGMGCGTTGDGTAGTSLEGWVVGVGSRDVAGGATEELRCTRCLVQAESIAVANVGEDGREEG